MENKKYIVLAVLVVVMIASISILLRMARRNALEKDFTGLSSAESAEPESMEGPFPESSHIYEQSSGSEENQSAMSKLPDLVPESSVLPEIRYNPYGVLHEENSDFIGWIKIDGTSIDHPVMYRPDRPGFYLTHDFEQKESETGLPYLAESCTVGTSDNLIIHLMNQKDGTAFGALEQYREQKFYDEYRLISFNTLQDRNIYEIFTVIVIDDEKDSFQYDAFIRAASETEYDSFIQTCKELSIYQTSSLPKYGDPLLTLAAADHTNENGRLVIVGRLVQ